MFTKILPAGVRQKTFQKAVNQRIERSFSFCYLHSCQPRVNLIDKQFLETFGRKRLQCAFLIDVDIIRFNAIHALDEW